MNLISPSSTALESVEVISLVKEWFADIGVDLEIEPLEYGEFWGVVVGKQHETMVYEV